MAGREEGRVRVVVKLCDKLERVNCYPLNYKLEVMLP